MQWSQIPILNNGDFPGVPLATVNQFNGSQLADYVRPLKKPVRARYCKGLFTQVPYRDGTVFNVSNNRFVFIK